MEEFQRVVGLDVGGTNIKAIVVDSSGAELDRSTVATPRQRSALLNSVRELLSELAGAPATPLVGLSCPGLAAPDSRSIAWMQGRMEILQGLDWTEALGRERTVWVLNDAHAATLGEAWLGAAKSRQNVVLLTLGTGIGGGVIVDGRLLQGQIGRAGHLGHLCLDVDGLPDICRTPGSLEDAVGECTLEARARGRFRDTQALVEAVREGDEEANEVWRRVVRALACGLASLINVVDPEVVVLGGGIAQAGGTLFEPLGQQMDEVEWRPLGAGVPIVPAALGDFAGAFGAARYAMDREVPVRTGGDGGDRGWPSYPVRSKG